MVLGDGNEASEFVSHEITTGINKLFEGDYKCAPYTESGSLVTEFGNLNVLAVSSDNTPVIMYSTTN